MSQKHRKFSPEFKAKVVLELLEGNATLNEIASKYNILPKSLRQWKKQFMQNASNVFENSVSIKKHKEEIKEKELQIEALSKALGKAIIERDWLSKRVRSLGLSKLRCLVQPKLKTLSVTRQCKLLGIARSSLYYKTKPPLSDMDIHIMNLMDEIYTTFP